MQNALRQFKATIFQALAHPTRIAILELLREQELPVSVMIERLRLEPANASQHFAVLRTRHIVTSRKAGNQVFYAIRDPLIIEVLDIMRRYFQVHLEESMSLLTEAEQGILEEPPSTSNETSQERASSVEKAALAERAS